MPEAASAKPWLSHPQQILYGRLVRAFPGHVVLFHVALDELLAARQVTGDRPPNWVAEFVLCRADFTALAVLELGQAGDGRAGEIDHSRRRDRMLRDAGVKVVRLSANDIPREASLKALVATLPLHASTSEMMRCAVTVD